MNYSWKHLSTTMMVGLTSLSMVVFGPTPAPAARAKPLGALNLAKKAATRPAARSTAATTSPSGSTQRAPVSVKSTGPAAGVNYNIVDLGVLPGIAGSSYTGHSTAVGINNKGEVVGDSTTANSSAFNPDFCPEFTSNVPSRHAFIWTPAFGMRDLGPPFVSSCQSRATSINDHGYVTGFAEFKNSLPSGCGAFPTTPYHALLWIPDSAGSLGMNDLGTIRPWVPCDRQPPDTFAQAVNPVGDKIVGNSRFGAFLWHQGAQQAFEEGLPHSSAYGINSSGVVVGGYTTSSGKYHAYRRAPDGTMMDLPPLPGSLNSEAFAINANNEVVGYSEDLFHDYATYWDSTGNPHDLGVSDGFAFGINSLGDVVGYYSDGPFLWSDDGGLVYLNNLLPPDSGWELYEAYGINDKGQIVGNGEHNGLSRAFLLDPCVDTDSDGLCDNWETDGIDVQVEGNTVHLDLPAMGADPQHKDIFVQLDTLGNAAVTQAALNVSIEAFARSPVSNPEGKPPGITLHVDNGPNSIMNPETGATWGNLSRASSISGVADLGNLAEDGSFPWKTTFDSLKEVNFPKERAPVFHYAISEPVDILAPDEDGNLQPAASGSSRGGFPGGASDFIVAAPKPRYSDNEVGSVFMHELGHNLGLDHGGGDMINKKPNYLSIMNYMFQLSGLQLGFHEYDYSRWGPDAAHPDDYLPVLDETMLDEQIGFGVPATSSLGQLYTISRYCTSTDHWLVVPMITGPKDWDCDGTKGGIVATDINGDGLQGLIAPYDDWHHLVYTGGQIGKLAKASLPETTQNIEPTPDELFFFADLFESAGDAAPPVTTATSATPANTAGWNRDNVTVTLTATDNDGGSGIKQITYSADGAQPIASTIASGASASFTLTTEGVTMISYFATDNAGNLESAQSLRVKLDKTAPSVSGSRAPAPNENGWNNSDVTVSFTCSDGLAGMDSCGPSPQTVTTDGTRQSRTGTAVDLAGNTATATVSDINIDTSKPTSHVTQLDASQPSVIFNVNWSGTDNGSGVQSYTIFVSENGGPFTPWIADTTATSGFLPGQPAKTYAFYCIARDQTGNIENAKISGEATTTTTSVFLNSVDDPRFFVWQHYLDFLSRQPDQDGWDYWTSQITECAPSDAVCIHNRRIAVSDAFFFEPEFQQTGSFVLRLYRAAFGDNQAFPNPDLGNPSGDFYPGPDFHLRFPSYAVFSQDRAQVVGGPGVAQSQLALANDFVDRPEFLAKYPASLSGPEFVDAILTSINGASGSDLTSQIGVLNDLYTQGGRGLVMFHLANDYWNRCDRLPGQPPAPCLPSDVGPPVDNRPFIDAEYNLTFVTTEYFGYLRRDGDANGLNFWLIYQINRYPLRDTDVQHAMVCSFITSAEYQLRFGAMVTRMNDECPQ